MKDLPIVTFILAIGCIFALDEKPFVCSSRLNTSQRTDFCRNQWMLARQELNLSHAFSPKSYSYLKKFYGFAASATMYYMWDVKSFVLYCRVYKCANEGIRGNLFNMMTSFHKRKGYFYFPKHFNSPVMLESTKSKFSAGYKDLFSLQPFTFIRNPLARFISGLAEFVYRTRGHAFLMTEATLATLLTNILDFKSKKLSSLAELEHIYPMSNIFFEWDITYLGYLETFKQDWHEIRRIHKLLHFPAFNSTYDRKPTTRRDPNAVKSSSVALFKNHRRYLRAVCRILMIDYVCFPKYKLPEECADFEVDRIEGTRMIKE